MEGAIADFEALNSMGRQSRLRRTGLALGERLGWAWGVVKRGRRRSMLGNSRRKRPRLVSNTQPRLCRASRWGRRSNLLLIRMALRVFMMMTLLIYSIRNRHFRKNETRTPISDLISTVDKELVSSLPFIIDKITPPSIYFMFHA